MRWYLVLYFILVSCSGDEIIRPQTVIETGCKQLQGLADVIDGDTVDVGNTRVRLLYIDAPEIGDECFAEVARDELQEIIEGYEVTVTNPLQRCVDVFDRKLGVLSLGVQDIGLLMVSRGLACAAVYDGVEYPDSYAAAMSDAANRQAGIWGCATNICLDGNVELGIAK